MGEQGPVMPRGVRVAIDRGGTFCDVWAYVPASYKPFEIPQLYLGNATVDATGSSGSNDAQVTFKLLSVDPANYDDAPSEGIRRLLQMLHRKDIPKDTLYDSSILESVRMGTTVATNALLERKGERFGLVLTEGFPDLLEIGDQTRPDLFDLSISRKPRMLYQSHDVIEAKERVTLEGWSLDPASPTPEELIARAKENGEDGSVVKGVSGEAVRVIKPLDLIKLETDLRALRNRGVSALAVCLMHSYTFPEHEKMVGELALSLGFTQISLSSQLSPVIKALPRANSAALDAYLSPVLRTYVDGFTARFNDERMGEKTEFMKSDGGLVASTNFSGLRAILSGPAGGYVGCATTAYSPKLKRPVIGFDMGGTSTDVCRYDGTFDLAFEGVIANTKIACPQLLIETVAAGGGSKLGYRNGLFTVGPESVGAHPGPVCYRKGGSLAITDANLVLGRLVPSQFPKIFGKNADEELDVKASKEAFRKLTDSINAERPGSKPFSLYEVAAGFVRVANEGMSRPMRKLTEQKGYVMGAHDLCCFGGAGGQHACSIAQSLGINTVIVPRFSSVLSAYGIACANLTAEATSPFSAHVEKSPDFSNSKSFESLEQRILSLKMDVQTQLTKQGLSPNDISLTTTVSVCYDGADHIIHLEPTPTLYDDFKDAHLRETSFNVSRKVLVTAIRVRGEGTSYTVPGSDYAEELARVMSNGSAAQGSRSITTAYFEVQGEVSSYDTPIYLLREVPLGQHIDGPALIVDATQTIVVEPYAEAICTREHVVINVRQPKRHVQSGSVSVDETDPILLAVFANRFMAIAEQMGHTLQRTSVSVSIKERLDFSCSIHGTDGALVANAPHIPVHLGSMQYAVQAQHLHWLGRLKPGDVLLTNHPQWGGTHLPDLTVITPVFEPNSDSKILFYVASRGHHTDIGGTGVTSMNPISKELWEEGVSVKTFKLVSGGEFNEDGVRELFNEPAKYPGSSATRRIDHNITDLQAAISANVRGIGLVNQLFEEFGTNTVIRYMREIQLIAGETVKAFLRDTSSTLGSVLRAEDFMDDGTRIKLEVRIDGVKGTAEFDWTGTDAQSLGNMNCPIALSYAAIIYSLRCMIDARIPMPLNQGVLDPVTNIVPEGSFLNPSGLVAIAGSTISSQRLIDVILQAFKAAACSQGCASSTGFGTGGKDALGNVIPGFTYGESLGGGSGAGPSWHGASAVCVHSTNTKLTDTEVFEQRCPMMLLESKIRRGTGGKGKYRGGDGMSKLFEARIPVNFSIVSQRRVFAPKGMEGGQDGERGKNTWYKFMGCTEGVPEYEEIRVPSNGMASIARGDRIRIDTPGGGGYGLSDANSA